MKLLTKYKHAVDVASKDDTWQAFFVYLSIFVLPLAALATGALVFLVLAIVKSPLFALAFGVIAISLVIANVIFYFHSKREPKAAGELYKKVRDEDYDPDTYPREF